MDKRIYLLTTICFVVGMVELIIGGILNLVAADLGVSIGQAGLLITVFAVTFGISGPILLFLTGQADRKRVTVTALCAFFIGNLLAVFSSTYSILLLSRVISAASGALLTVLCLTLAAHIAKREFRGRAIGLVTMGISASIVLGLPIGVSMGHAYGWRSPFILITILTIILIVGVFKFFGKVPTKPPVSLKKQLQALKNNRVFLGHLTTFFFLAGHFTLYGYLTPFVISNFGFGGPLVTIVYFVYGVAAVTGGGLAGMSADTYGARRTLLTVIVLLIFCLLLIPYSSIILFWLILIIWGILSWAISPPIQSHLVQLSPETSDIQQSLNNASLHLGIALGTSVGSLIIDQYSIKLNALIGAMFVIVALGTAIVSLQREREVVKTSRA